MSDNKYVSSFHEHHQRVKTIRAWIAYAAYHAGMKLEGEPKEWAELTPHEQNAWHTVIASVTVDVGREVSAMAIMSHEPLTVQDTEHIAELIKEFGIDPDPDAGLRGLTTAELVRQIKATSTYEADQYITELIKRAQGL